MYMKIQTTVVGINALWRKKIMLVIEKAVPELMDMKKMLLAVA